MHLRMLRAEAPRFARRIAAAAFRAAAAIVLLLIAVIYALSAAHAALASEIGSVRASLVLAGALFVLALLLLLVAKHGVAAARTDIRQAAAYDFEDVRRRSLGFVRAAGRFVGLRWIPIALRAVRATPWRVAIGIAAMAGAVFLLWPFLRAEWRRSDSASTRPPPPAA